MFMPKVLLRNYQNLDYHECESLVNGAWGFDVHFKPKALSKIALCLYTQGSVVNSNFRKVIEVDGKVAGFLLGWNESWSRPKGVIGFGLSILFKILCVRGVSIRKKMALLGAMRTHEINRTHIFNQKKSEVVLFVIAPEYQGQGYGKRLLFEFIQQCQHSGVQSIIVETNKRGASNFYEQVGFKHVGNFESPLHEYVTKNGQPCLYEYLLFKSV